MASLRSKVAEHLACAVCLEQFQNPKVLPCLHSYCHDCIMKLKKTNDNITCPECRIQVKVGNPPDISFLPSNFFINNLLATVSLENDAEDRIICEHCDSADSAQGRCQQCCRYLCEFCINAHKRVRDTKGHIIKNLEDLKESGPSVMAKIMYCSKHKDEIVKLYCTTCQETICRDCAIIDHREHSFLHVGDVVEEKRAELEQLVEDVKERKTNVSSAIEEVKKIEENLTAQTESTITEINQYFENILKSFEKRRDKFIEKANNLKLTKLKQLHVQREELEMALTSFESSIQFTQQAFENGSDVELLNMKKFIAESLNSLKSQENDVKPCVDGHIEFVAESTVDEIVHEGLFLCSVVGKRYDQVFYDKCKVSITPGNLSPGNEAEVEIFCPDCVKKGKSNIKLLFSGVEVKDVVKRRSFSPYNMGFWRPTPGYVVRFVPAGLGTLLVNLCVNGRSLPQTTLVRSVTWDWEDGSPDNNTYISNYAFVSGVHSWEIKLDHESCSERCGTRCNFTIGVIGQSGTFVGLTGYVTSVREITVNLDMERKKMIITPSWNLERYAYDIKSPAVRSWVDIDDLRCECIVEIITKKSPNSFRRNTSVYTFNAD